MACFQILIRNFTDPIHPYQNAVFGSDEGNKKTFKLSWRDFEPTESGPLRKMRRKIEHFKVSKYKGLYWVSLNTFQLNDKLMEGFREMLRQLNAISGPEAVVFDLRGNNGGSSILGCETLKALYPDEIFSEITRLVEEREAETKAMWRVSVDNYNHLKDYLLPYVNSQVGDKSSRYINMESTASKMAEGLRLGCELIEEDDFELAERGEAKDSYPISQSEIPKSIIITDESCGSACLDFVDLVKAFPGTIHLGKETFGDSVYMEVRAKKLPSGIGVLVIPQKVYRNRIRGNNENHKPDIPFFGNIYDDEALKPWVVDLISSLRA